MSLRQVLLSLIVPVLLLGAPHFALGDQPQPDRARATGAQVGERIILMRHAEKPDDPFDPNLTTAGRQRAKALAPFIMSKYGKPDFIFAAANSRKSSRSYETATPLSQVSGVPIDSSFNDKDFRNLAAMLIHDTRFRGKFVVVVWHHGSIADFCQELDAKPGSYPRYWKSSVFDQILQFDYGEAKQPKVTTVVEPF